MATVIILLPLLILMELIEDTGVIGGSNRKYGGRKQLAEICQREENKKYCNERIFNPYRYFIKN